MWSRTCQGCKDLRKDAHGWIVKVLLKYSQRCLHKCSLRVNGSNLAMWQRSCSEYKFCKTSWGMGPHGTSWVLWLVPDQHDLLVLRRWLSRPQPKPMGVVESVYSSWHQTCLPVLWLWSFFQCLMKFGGKEIHPLLKLFTMSNIKGIVDQDGGPPCKAQIYSPFANWSQLRCIFSLLGYGFKIFSKSFDEFQHFFQGPNL